MVIYYSLDEAVNVIDLPPNFESLIIVGWDKICENIVDNVVNAKKSNIKPHIIAFDGFLGVQWENIIGKITKLLRERKLNYAVKDFSQCFLPGLKIKEIITPYISYKSFGYVFKGRLENLLDENKVEKLKVELKNYKKQSGLDAVLCFGCGSAIPYLRRLYDHVYYFDLTREELFNESERRPIHLFGSEESSPPVHADLKRFYYVESQLLNKQKKYLMKHMDWYVESNFTKEPKLIPKKVYDALLSTISNYPFKIKPLYYPVTWGGNWLKEIKHLPNTMPNSGQACIVASENSIRIKVSEKVIEMPFINLMWHEADNILGMEHSKKFNGEFPFTYWYDDGIEGGNMAIQVHPNTSYIKKHFNEPIRQDESYYILHTGPGSKTYLGLKDDVNIEEFYEDAARSEKLGVPLDYEKYVNSIPTKMGDYFLIPAGTVHASGRNQAVLEVDSGIAAHSPGYTFHIYDYLKPDLDGKLRDIHLEHAFNVLKGYRRASWVKKNLQQTPTLIRSGEDWAEYLLGRRKDMFFEVRRLEFQKKIEDSTNGVLTILSLVEGENVLIHSKSNQRFKCELQFPDTATIPACFGEFLIVNLGEKPCKVLKALLK